MTDININEKQDSKSIILEPTLKQCSVYGLTFKEVDNSYIVKGYTSTTHLDSGFFDSDLGKIVRDKIDVKTLIEWKDDINKGVPRANKVTLHHDRSDVNVIGVSLKGSARLDKFNDGEFGLYVETVINDTHPKFIDIKRGIELGTLDSFSIEYKVKDSFKLFDKGDYYERVLLPGTEFHGYSILSRPMNEHAVMVKSLIQVKTDNEDEINEDEKKKGKESVDKDTDTNTNTNTENESTENESKDKEDKTMTDGLTITKEEHDFLLKAKEEAQRKTEESKFMNFLETKMKDEQFKKDIFGLNIQAKVLKNDVEEQEITPEQKQSKVLFEEYKGIVSRTDLDIRSKFAEVGLIAEKSGMIRQSGVDSIEYKTCKTIEPVKGKVMSFNFRTNGSKLEVKGLGITTNQNTDTDYLLSSAELRDMFDPVIYDAMNLSTTTWALLRKEDYSNKGNNQVQFVLWTGENSARGFYTGNAVTTGNSTRLKMQTKFKKYQVGISVDGDMIAAANGGPIGDVFGLEVEYGTRSMISDLNSALFADVGLETASAPIGFEYLTNSAGNTTLYNLTRSTTNKLSPTSATDTYINASSARITTSLLRQAIQQATTEGANINNLVFVTHPIQERLFKDLMQGMQTIIPTSSRIGFTGRPEIDAVPVFSDKDCNTDDWWLIDLETHKVAIWVPPTLEMLGKRSDAEEGFIKTYYAVYNVAPRRMVQIYGCATS